MTSPFTFVLPDDLVAKEPLEARRIARDQVRLMIIDRETYDVAHTKFDRIGDYLRSGDLLVCNASRTLPASLNGCAGGAGPCLEVRLAQHLADGDWLALLLCRQGDPFSCGLRREMQLDFGLGLKATVTERDARVPRLWRLHFSRSGSELVETLYRIGQPVRYEYVSAPWNLDYYQNIYAREPGSAEMPSAGRAFTWKLLFDLKHQGIESTYVLLHTGLSSYMDDDLDKKHLICEEEYLIGEEAASKIASARKNGGRIIAVGTTVVRALESGAHEHKALGAAHGYTRLRITSGHALKAVDGLLTGLHEPEASHLDMLAAFLPPNRIKNAYEDAVKKGYLWHEFGDLNLIL